MNCPRCAALMVRGERFWVCGQCGHSLPSAEPSEKPPALVGVDLQRWPHVLEVSLAEYARAAVPYIKLHRLTDAAETLTRFCTAVALADLLDHSPQEGFPETVRQELRHKLDRPTFGAWRELLKTAVEALPYRRGQRRGVLAELAALVRERLLPLLGSGSSP